MEKVSKDMEYNMLKQEIINTSDIIVNIMIAIYTISVSIFVFAFECNNSYAFLLPYIILLPFQNLINRKRDEINRIAAYIAVYLEDGDGWESNLKKNMEVLRGFDNHTASDNKFCNFIIGRTNCSQIGLFCTIFFVVSYYKRINMGCITLENVILLSLAFGLPFTLFSMNKRASLNMSTRDVYIKRLEQDKMCKEKCKESI